MQEKEKLPISVFIFIKKKIIVFSTVLCRYTGVTFLLKTDTTKDQMKIQTLSFMCEIFLRKRQYHEEFKKSCIDMSPDPLNINAKICKTARIRNTKRMLIESIFLHEVAKKKKTFKYALNPQPCRTCPACPSCTRIFMIYNVPKVYPTYCSSVRVNIIQLIINTTYT